MLRFNRHVDEKGDVFRLSCTHGNKFHSFLFSYRTLWFRHLQHSFLSHCLYPHNRWIEVLRQSFDFNVKHHLVFFYFYRILKNSTSPLEENQGINQLATSDVPLQEFISEFLKGLNFGEVPDSFRMLFLFIFGAVLENKLLNSLVPVILHIIHFTTIASHPIL